MRLLWLLGIVICFGNVYGGYDAEEVKNLKFPEWPKDFAFSANGRRKGEYCISVTTGHQKSEDDYFCVNIRKGFQNPLLHWIQGRKF